MSETMQREMSPAEMSRKRAEEEAAFARATPATNWAEPSIYGTTDRFEITGFRDGQCMRVAIFDNLDDARSAWAAHHEVTRLREVNAAMVEALDAAETILRYAPTISTNALGTKPPMTTPQALEIARAALAQAKE